LKPFTKEKLKYQRKLPSDIKTQTNFTSPQMLHNSSNSSWKGIKKRIFLDKIFRLL